jgi:hypothetical protein
VRPEGARIPRDVGHAHPSGAVVEAAVSGRPRAAGTSSLAGVREIVDER